MQVHGGQLNGRQERLQKTASWLNATPVDLNNRPIHVGPAEGEVQLDVVSEIVTTIRCALASGVGQIDCDEPHLPNINAIHEWLSPEERLRVRFIAKTDAADQASRQDMAD
jgi:hypothetical protein